MTRNDTTAALAAPLPPAAIVRCTQKLLAVIRPARLADDPPDGGDWYANLLWFTGRKCLLLTRAATLSTVFEPDVRGAGLRDTGRLVTGLIRRELAREQLPAARSAAWTRTRWPWPGPRTAALLGA